MVRRQVDRLSWELYCRRRARSAYAAIDFNGNVCFRTVGINKADESDRLLIPFTDRTDVKGGLCGAGFSPEANDLSYSSVLSDRTPGRLRPPRLSF